MRKFCFIIVSVLAVMLSPAWQASAQETSQKKGFFHRFNVGLTAVDFGYCPSTYDRNSFSEVKTDFYYDLGASIKYGDYLAPVQIEAGILPGLIFRKVKTAEEEKSGSDFRLVSFLRAKANICDAFKGSKLFASASGLYNIIDESEKNFSVGINAGIAWKHIEWSVFYRMPIGGTDGYAKGYVGTTATFYLGL
jgi:hypothetical protein